MRYIDVPQLEPQRRPLFPHKIISGMLPGATEIRIGGNENIKISGKDQRISVVNSGTTLSFGNQGSGDLQLALSDGTTNIIKLGNLGSSYMGLAFNDASFDRIFVGKKPDGTHVARLSQSGYDAKTATADQLIWSSEFNNFKIVGSPRTVNLQIVSTGTGIYGETTLAHGLDFLPSYHAFITLDTDIAALAASPATNLVNPAITYADVGGTITLISVSTVSVDDTDITFSTQLSSLVGAGTYDFSAKVYLLRETFS